MKNNLKKKNGIKEDPEGCKTRTSQQYQRRRYCALKKLSGETMYLLTLYDLTYYSLALERYIYMKTGGLRQKPRNRSIETKL